MLPEEINEKTTVAELAAEIAEHPNLWGMHSIEDAINKIISLSSPTPTQPKDEGYWKQRCEAAEKVIKELNEAFPKQERLDLILDAWQSLRTQQPIDDKGQEERQYNKDLSKYGDVMDAVQFEKDLAEEKRTRHTILGFSSQDGNGYWVKDGKQSNDDIFSTPKLDATHIIWFNK